MEIAMLGPLEVRIDGRVVALGGPKQRALLAILALHANELVSRDRLIEALWGERPPSSVDGSLDTYLSRLRRELGRDRVVRRPGGYVLRLEQDELDVDRFERLVEHARDARDAEAAARLLREAIALWRGPALADVLYTLNGDAERLEERRLTALEELFDLELAAGGGSELVGQLERLHNEHPLRERLLGQLMLALYRAGRHAESLSVLQAARQRLAAELGLEPGPGLRDLELRILRHDPDLDPRPRRERASGRPRWPFAAGLAAAAVAAVVTFALLGSGSADRRDNRTAGSNGLLAIDGRSGEVTERVGVTGSLSAVAAGAGSIWAVDSSDQTVTKVDPTSGSILDRIRVGAEPGGLVWGAGAIWVTTTLGAAIKRIDPITAAVTQTVRVDGANATAVSFGRRGLWAVDATNRALVEIDPAAGSVRKTLPLDLTPSAIQVGRRAIWVAGYDEGVVEEIDPQSGESLTAVRVGQGPSSLAVDSGAVWVANSLDATVSRIDIATGTVEATIPVGSGPTALAVAGGSVWVANAYSGTLSRIDARRNQVVATLRVGRRPAALAAADGEVWVGTATRDDTQRGGTLRLVTQMRFPSIDPAFQDVTAVFTRLAYDTLVSFSATPGPAGLRLVPDLGLEVPTPTRGGTVYAFRLRPGIRYWDARPLRARDFRRAIERLFRVDSPGASNFTAVVGAAACVRRPARCELARGIVTNDAAGSVVFHLGSPDPDFLYKLTVVGFSAPVPPNTPDRDVGSSPVPGTGPYRVAESSDTELRLTRNPYFREWSHAAQPNGNPDVVVWHFVGTPAAAIREVDRGEADWVSGLIPPNQARRLEIRRPAQLHRNPSFAVDFIPLNTNRPPFDDLRVRQALNYAIDRNAIARMYGMAVRATPICQPLPPGFRGYKRYCPYTLGPRADGRWSAPDLARARRLVASSGTKGARVAVWGTTDLPYVPRALPAYVARVLRSLGYRATLHLVPYASFTPATRRSMQLTVDGDWVPDYAAPSSYLPTFFGCHGGHNRKSYVCDPHLDARMRQAATLELQDPPRAAAFWADIDRELVDRAYWVPTVNVGVTELVSRRLRNYQYHPIWGFMAGQASVR